MVEIDPQVLTVGSVVSTAVIAWIGGLFKLWEYLGKKFNVLEDSINKLLDAHEDKDQKRHEDNLVRLTKLEVLIKNGNEHH